jgi:hypothetical protein
MKAAILLFICSFPMLFSGCTRYYVNLKPQGRTFDGDSNYCNAVSYGQVPFQMPVLQGDQSAITQGNVTITDPSGNMTRGTYTANTQYYNNAAHFNNMMALTSGLAQENRRRAIWGMCMSSRGWIEVTKEQQDIIMGRNR